MFLFNAYADADGIDAKPKFICKTSYFFGDKNTLLDEEWIGLQLDFIGKGPPISHHNILDRGLLHHYSVTFSCCSACFYLPRK